MKNKKKMNFTKINSDRKMTKPSEITKDLKLHANGYFSRIND